MKQTMITAALTLIFISCTGCESSSFFPLQTEIDDVTIVRIFAIDLGAENPDNIRVIVVIQSGSEPTTDGEGKKNNNTAILSCEGKTISSATRALQEYVNKKLFYGHVDICLIGEPVADNDIYGVMDFLSRDPEFRLNSFIFITKDSATDLLAACDSEVYYLPERIQNIAKNMTLSSSNYLLRIQKVSSLLDDNDFSAIAMPVLGVKEINEDEDKETMTAPAMEVASYAVVKGGKLVGYVEKEDMLGYNLISGNIKYPIIDIDINEGTCIALEVVQGKTAIIPVMEGSALASVIIRTEVHANINEMKQVGYPLIEKTIYELEDKLKAALSERIAHCVETAKLLNADFIGINSAVFHKQPITWNNIKSRYDEVFPALPITVEVKARIDRTYDTWDSIRSPNK